MTRRILICLICLMAMLALPVQARLQNLVINELMAANVSYMLDDTYNYGGWIELYNNSPKSINLSGYSLSDEASNPRKYEFFRNAGVFAPDVYKIVYFENHGLNAYHVDFKLDADGAALYLYEEQIK